MPRTSPLFPAVPIATLLLTLSLGTAAAAGLDLPWREAGLTERQAAAHLLDRFAYGARPGDVDGVVEIGLDVWLERQLAGSLPDRAVEKRLEGLRSLEMSTREMVETYPNPGMVMIQARRDGVIDGELSREQMEEMGRGERSEQRRQLMEYAREKGYRPMREMLGELMVQKLIRARYSENQLTEVLTDFWFNHFNVSITDNESRPFVSSYERDAIRPHVLGDFRAMLEATAKHPAMLLYLDNARSVAPEGTQTTCDRDRDMRSRGRGGFGRRGGRGGFGRGGFGRGVEGDSEMRRAIEQRRPQGLNENYARELMELHTLGVDGGYTQDDVIEVARAFTGWATYPPGPARRAIEQRIARARRIPDAGFVFEESFIFRADAHDAEKKTILGATYPAGRGIEDGLAVLDQLTAHPSTARHIATKLAVRFVSDEPPEALVDRLADHFRASGGDLLRVTRALAESPEFWQARGAKIKSPFELTASALRATGAEIEHPRAVIEWVRRMGQPLYAYQAPTGYPDRATAWVNTGSLLNRMNFGLQLATGRVAGLELALAGLNGNREPESLDAALSTYVPLLMPERDPTETVRRLEPVVRDPELAKKIEDAAPADEGSRESFFDDFGGGSFGGFGGPRSGESAFGGPGRRGRWRDRAPLPTDIDNSPLAHVVGVILGSPEFQRR